MEKLFRLYNQNRKKVWLAIIVFIFAIIIIKTLNSMYREKSLSQEETNTYANTTQNQTKYENQSKSLVSGGSVSESYKEKFGNLIDNFLTYCKNHEPEKAYGLLSEDCKNAMYPNEQIFEQQYYSSKFKGEKKYSFQSWTSTDTYIYLVKIFNNMLATGMGDSENYIQDYISVVKENDTYKLNVNGFVGKIKRNAEKSKDGLTIKINYSEIYMDYELVNITIKNDTENTVLLDSRKNTESMYLLDYNKNKFISMAYENMEDDFIINPGEEKKINLKFCNPYREKMPTTEYVFSDIEMNADESGDKQEIVIDLN